MTEFLKGYAAGANDMEAGRLVTAKPTREPYRSRRNDYQALSEYWAKRARSAEASALTAEEAKAVRAHCRGDRIKSDRMADYQRGIAKLSLIANGENG